MTRILLFLLAIGGISHAQVSVQPYVGPHNTFVDLSGSPCAGCKLSTFLAGTTTPTPTYTDSAGTSQNTNPIVLDVAGGANIWPAVNVSYKYMLKDALGSTIWTVDNVKGISGPTGPTGPAGPAGPQGPAGVGVNPFSTGKFAFPGVNEFGDSITAGDGATTPSNSYAQIMGVAFGGTANNLAQSGDMSADMAVKVTSDLNPSYSSQPATTMMIGTNDANICGTSTGCHNNYMHFLLSSIGWASVPNEVKVRMGYTSSSVTTTGTWTTDSTLQTNLARQTIVNGSTITFTTIVPSTVMYLAWMGRDGDTSSGSLSCDSGAVTDTLTSAGFNGQTIATFNGTTAAPFATRYVFTANALHTCTVIASASTGNPFSIVWAGTPQPTTPNSFAYPTASSTKVFVGGVIRQAGGINDAVNVQYDTIASTTAGTMATDSPNVAFVDTRTAVNTTTDFTAGTLANGISCPNSTDAPIHPGDCGHKHLADAFLAIAQPVGAAFAIPPQLNLFGTTPWVTLASNTSNSRLTPDVLFMNGVNGLIRFSNSLSSLSSAVAGISFNGTKGATCIGNGTQGDCTGDLEGRNITAEGGLTGGDINSNSGTANNDLAPLQLQLNASSPIAWSNNASNSLVTKVTGLSQIDPAVVGVGNGTQGDTSGTLKTRYFRPDLATQPTGSCGVIPNGTLALSSDGHASSCSGGNWVSRW